MKNKNYWSSDLEEEVNYPTSFIVEESDPHPTGLLDSKGNPIYRIKNQIGFLAKL